MSKVMIFIDGTWLYSNTRQLSLAYGDQDFRVDFGKLPAVLAEAVNHQIHHFAGHNGTSLNGNGGVDVVRTYLFGSYANNCDERDHEAVQSQRDFYDVLKEEYHYEVDTYPVNFAGRRLRKIDRDPHDTFEPREKCVDIALATTMLYLAAVPTAYDIGIAVIGDRDFTPMLQHVRRLGKRVAIASIKDSCTPDFADPRDEARVKDFDMIWLDDLLHKLEFKHERQLRLCESPTHKGSNPVWSTFRPRKGHSFFCEECRRENRLRRDSQRDPISAPIAAPVESPALSSAFNPTTPIPPTPTVVTSSLSEDIMPSNGLRASLAVPIAAPSLTQRMGERMSEGLRDRYGDRLMMTLTGYVTTKFGERRYGFIRAEGGDDYHFHATDLHPDLDFDVVPVGLQVEFEVKRPPSENRAGAAQNVRLQASDSI